MHVVRFDERLFLRAMSGTRVCKGCGAESQAGPELCQLCGKPTEGAADLRPTGKGAADLRTIEIERYQAEVRRLRRQLKESSRGNARAV